MVLVMGITCALCGLMELQEKNPEAVDKFIEIGLLSIVIIAVVFNVVVWLYESINKRKDLRNQRSGASGTADKGNNEI
jgi:high-affinity Fe2+/Pb2+ permease